MSGRRRCPVALARRPSVTVVVPCYNYGHYLAGALASVLSQPGVDVEAIVIDDASPDGSAAVVRELAATDERVRAVIHQRNCGHIATYNEGLEQATGDYVVLLSADDGLTPGALARATALFEAHPSVGLVYGFPVVFEHEFPPARTQLRSWTVWSGGDWIERLCRAGENCIYNPEVVLRTSVQREIGGYDPRLPHSGDLEMWMRAATVADVGRVNGSAQAFYRVHAGSMQRTVNAGHMIDLEGRLDAFRKVLVGPASRLNEGERLFATARLALARCALDYARLACETRDGDGDGTAEYLAFAERVWPRARELRDWKAVERASRAHAGPLQRAVVAPARRTVRDVRDRVRWRRWRWSGV